MLTVDGLFEMSREHTAATPHRKSLKRKFPGPAGLLNGEGSSEPEHKLIDNYCSQTTLTQFNDGPWEKMRRDFEILNERNTFLPDRYTIAWVKSMAKENKLPNQKAQFLAGIITKINTKTSIVTMVLKDTTGQINGTIVNALYEDYHKHLIIGSVIVLRQVGVLTTKNSSCYLTITANNLVKIYSQTNVVSLRHCSMSDFVVDKEPMGKRARPEASVVVKESQSDFNDDEDLHNIFDGVDADLLFDDF